MSLRVLLVDESRQRTDLLMAALLAAGHEVVVMASADEDLQACVEREQPDVIIMDMDAPCRDTLEHVCMITRDQRRPVVMFTHDNDREKIRAAVKAGVSAYIVGGLSSERVQPIIEVAMARFEEYQALRRELEKAHSTLAERKVIERAKGIVMQQRGCSEDEAYRLLRKAAMDKGQRLYDVAHVLVSAADLLG